VKLCSPEYSNDRDVYVLRADGTIRMRLGDTRFALARARALAGRDPQRSRHLARAARDDYARAANLPQRVAEVEGWLA
jgi:hypothetical protein